MQGTPEMSEMRRCLKSALGVLAVLAVVGAPLLQPALAVAAAKDAAPLQSLGIDHVGMNVPDIDAAVSFFGALLGTRVVLDASPDQPGTAWKRRFHWHPSSRLARIVMLQTPMGDRIELFQYQGRQITHQQPHEDDAGATHIAFRVTDISAAFDAVRRRGLRVLNEPVTNADGTRWFYFLTPWNAQLELVVPATMDH